MTFIQVIEYDSSRPAEVDKLMGEWQAATSGEAAGFRRAMHSHTHGQAGHFVDVVEFDSYEAAMANSARPETDAMARQMRALCDSEPRYLNLDVTGAYPA